MICEKCPVALLCFADTLDVRYCTRCKGLVCGINNYHGFPNMHERVIVTVRCTQYRLMHSDKTVKDISDLDFGGCIRCDPIGHGNVAGCARSVDHYHHGRDGNVLIFSHAKWCKRERWWLYRDCDEAPAGFYLPRPAEAP
jgi:hypothetical protein